MTTKELARVLVASKEALLIVQRDEILPALPDKVRNRCSRNRRPNGGWGVPGNSKWTRAMRLAGCPTNDFWSGMAPTPSTQYSLAFMYFLESIDR